MEENTERVKIRLNRLTILALKEFKRMKFGDSNLPVSDSYTLTEAYRKVLPNIDNIDWDEVNEAFIPNVTDNTEFPVSSLPTTLTLELDVLEGLSKIQKEMIEKKKSRVFFSYVVKLVLYAAILELNN